MVQIHGKFLTNFNNFERKVWNPSKSSSEVKINKDKVLFCDYIKTHSSKVAT